MHITKKCLLRREERVSGRWNPSNCEVLMTKGGMGHSQDQVYE